MQTTHRALCTTTLRGKGNSMSKKLLLKSISMTAAVAASLLLGGVAQAQTGATAAGSSAGMAGSGTNSPNDASGTPLTSSNPPATGSAKPNSGMAKSGMASDHSASGTVGKTRESSMKNSEKKAAKSGSDGMKDKSGINSKSAERNSATSAGTTGNSPTTTNTR